MGYLRITRRLLVLIGLLFFCRDGFATTDRFSLTYYRPAFSTGDFIHTIGSHRPKKWSGQAYAQFDFAYHPLEVTNNGQRTGGIVDRYLIWHLGGSVAPTPWYQMDIDVPLVLLNQFAEPSPTPGDTQNYFDFGDISIRNRFILLSKEESPVGLVLIPFLTLPSGDAGHFMGDSTVTGGGTLAVDFNLGKSVSGGINIGAKMRERTVSFDYDSAGLLIASAGLSYSGISRLELQTDILAITSFSNFANDSVNSLVEIDFGFRYAFLKNWSLNAQQGIAVVKGAGTPLSRTTLGVSYSW